MMYEKLFGTYQHYAKAKTVPPVKIRVTFTDNGEVDFTGHSTNELVCAAVSALRYAWERSCAGPLDSMPVYEALLYTVRELARLYPADLELDLWAPLGVD